LLCEQHGAFAHGFGEYYGQRATSENWIEWCKNHMASGSILPQDFWANSAIFQTCIPAWLADRLAYNLMVWMMWLNDEARFVDMLFRSLQQRFK